MKWPLTTDTKRSGDGDSKNYKRSVLIAEGCVAANNSILMSECLENTKSKSLTRGMNSIITLVSRINLLLLKNPSLNWTLPLDSLNIPPLPFQETSRVPKKLSGIIAKSLFENFFLQDLYDDDDDWIFDPAIDAILDSYKRDREDDDDDEWVHDPSLDAIMTGGGIAKKGLSSIFKILVILQASLRRVLPFYTQM